MGEGRERGESGYKKKCDILHLIEKKVPDTIFVRTPFCHVDVGMRAY